MSTLPVEMAIWIGQRIGNYRLARLLGQGGMGMVFEAVHDAAGSRAAIKLLRPEVVGRADVTARFFNEARAANAIQHPGIVRIFDCGYTTKGVAYLTMEFLDGESLRSRLDRALVMDAPDALRIGRQLASALVAAHRKNVIHRDLKPDNIMLVPDPDLPGGERVKILDFGIAKITEALSASPLQTRSDLLMGTPTHMAPEQCRGAKSVTDRSDVYSLGIILYQMVAGRPPFIGDTVGELIAMHLTDPPPLLRELVPDVSPRLADLVHAMLDKKPMVRPSMEGTLAEIHKLEAELNAAKAEAHATHQLTPETLKREALTAPLPRVVMAPAVAVPPQGATQRQPVVRQPGPGMRTFTEAASESTQLPNAKTARRSIRTLGAGIFALLMVASPIVWYRLVSAPPKTIQSTTAPRESPVLQPLPLKLQEPTKLQEPPKRPEPSNVQAQAPALPPDKLQTPALPEERQRPAKSLQNKSRRLAEALKALYQGNPMEARRLARAGFEDDPPRALWIVGLASCRRGDTADVQKALVELQKLKGPPIEKYKQDIREECSQADRQRGQTEKSRASLQRLRDAEVLFGAGNYLNARNIAQANLDADPLTAWEIIGRSACGLHDPVTATKAFKHLEVDTSRKRALESFCATQGHAYKREAFQPR